MDALELYAKARDGGPWFQLAAETWSLIAAIVALIATILLVIFLSARDKSIVGRLFSAMRPPHAEHLFMRVGVAIVPESIAELEDTSTAVPRQSQAYLASMAPHEMRLYAKFPIGPGTVLRIDPPGVHVVVQQSRAISEEPPWFSIEAEPVFRDDVTRRNYRKFLGELSQVA
ncbi:hypothetical protein EBZ80_09665 [bacterium]|nr:hypothetical protein [bacterium]